MGQYLPQAQLRPQLPSAVHLSIRRLRSMGFLSNPGSLSPGPFSRDAARLPLLPPALSSDRAATDVAPSSRAVRASASHVRRRPPSTAPPDPCCRRRPASRVVMTGAGAAPPLPTERDAEHHQRSITPFVLCENTQSLVYFYSDLSCNGLDLDGFAWSMGTPDPFGAMVERPDPWCTSSATVAGMAQEVGAAVGVVFVQCTA